MDDLFNDEDLSATEVMQRIAKFNKVDHRFSLINADSSFFIIRLEIGGETYSSDIFPTMQEARTNAVMMFLKSTWTELIVSPELQEASEYVEAMHEVDLLSEKLDLSRSYNSTSKDGVFHYCLRIGDGGPTFSGEDRRKLAAKGKAAQKARDFLKAKDKPVVAEVDPSTIERKQDLGPNEKSAMMVLNEIAVRRGEKVEYDLIEEVGPPHKKIFTFACTLGNMTTTAEGRSKKDAKRIAAEMMLDKAMGRKGPDISRLAPDPQPVEVGGAKKKRKDKSSLDRQQPSSSSSIVSVSLFRKTSDWRPVPVELARRGLVPEASPWWHCPAPDLRSTLAGERPQSSFRCSSSFRKSVDDDKGSRSNRDRSPSSRSSLTEIEDRKKRHERSRSSSRSQDSSSSERHRRFWRKEKSRNSSSSRRSRKSKKSRPRSRSRSSSRTAVSHQGNARFERSPLRAQSPDRSRLRKSKKSRPRSRSRSSSRSVVSNRGNPRFEGSPFRPESPDRLDLEQEVRTRQEVPSIPLQPTDGHQGITNVSIQTREGLARRIDISDLSWKIQIPTSGPVGKFQNPAPQSKRGVLQSHLPVEEQSMTESARHCVTERPTISNPAVETQNREGQVEFGVLQSHLLVENQPMTEPAQDSAIYQPGQIKEERVGSPPFIGVLGSPSHDQQEEWYSNPVSHSSLQTRDAMLHAPAMTLSGFPETSMIQIKEEIDDTQDTPVLDTTHISSQQHALVFTCALPPAPSSSQIAPNSPAFPAVSSGDFDPHSDFAVAGPSDRSIPNIPGDYHFLSDFEKLGMTQFREEWEQRFKMRGVERPMDLPLPPWTIEFWRRKY